MSKNTKRFAVGAVGLVFAGGVLLTPLPEAFSIYATSRVEAETLTAESAAVQDGWVTENGNTYYYSNGQKQYLTYRLKGKLYFFDRDTGAQQTGWVTYGGAPY